jgi:hypothetical protein
LFPCKGIWGNLDRVNVGSVVVDFKVKAAILRKEGGSFLKVKRIQNARKLGIFVILGIWGIKNKIWYNF